MKRWMLIFVVLVFGTPACAEQITVATYNIKMFSQHFLSRRLPTTRAWPEAAELLASERKHEDEDNWEIAQVILDPKFSPDVLVIQEGCSQTDLDYFDHRWLKDAYSTAIVFDTNTDREQTLCLLLKPGFKVLARKDQYYKEADTTANDRGNRLLARGPVFVLLEAPSGYRFWVGTNHQRSKSDNSLEVTQWRNREAKRTHQIIKEIETSGPSDVFFLGDMNDELGIQAYELAGGGDSIANFVGPAADGIFLATPALAEAERISYFGCSRMEYRSVIN